MSTTEQKWELSVNGRAVNCNGIQIAYTGDLKVSERIISDHNDSEASNSLEQRAKVAAEEIEGNMIPIRSGQSNVVRAQKIILRHFSGLGGGNEKKDLIEALKEIVREDRCDNDGRGCPVIDQIAEALKTSGETT